MTEETLRFQANPPRVVILIESTRAYGRRILRGIADYVRENGPWLVHIEPRALDDAAPGWLADWKGDGIIARLTDPASVDLVRKTGVPIVNLKSGEGKDVRDLLREAPFGPFRKKVPDTFSQADVKCDRNAVGRMAAEHLLERGFCNFGFIGVSGSWSVRQFEGFQDRVEEEGYPCSQYSWRQGRGDPYHDGAMNEEIDEIAAWVKKQPRPLGVLAADDFLGIEFINACRRAGIMVPDAVAVLGVDNEETVCRLSHPSLSSVKPNDIRIGREAASLLDRLMQGEPHPVQPLKIEPLEVVTRHSTDVTATADPMVAEAMQYIRTNAVRGINVNDVVSYLAVSRSALQRRFRRELNRPVYEVILNMRLNYTKELLAESELSLREIAIRSGFKHVEHMNNIFKQKTGHSLQKFRKLK